MRARGRCRPRSLGSAASVGAEGSVRGAAGAAGPVGRASVGAPRTDPCRTAGWRLAETLSQPTGTIAAMTATMLGQGMYDVAEVARLLGHDGEWVVRWSTSSAAGPAIVPATFDRWFSFADLVAFRVGLIVREHSVADRHLRHGVERLRNRTGLAQPLASHAVIAQLATSGDSFLWRLPNHEFEDIGRGGQGVFAKAVELYLSNITFDGQGSPKRWQPTAGVLIDPAIQAGAPCVAGTRIPTSTIADLLAVEYPEDVAADFDLSVEAVLLAEKFEQMLAAGHGLAA